MIILIPIGGIGNRFKEVNNNKPKALIQVVDKPIICHLLDNLINYLNNINFIYIPYNYNEYKDFNFESFLINNYPNINFKFFKLMTNTCGCASTIKIALENLINENNKVLLESPILSIDSDNFYKTNIIDYWNGENKIFTFKDYNIQNNSPKFSYIKFNDNQLIEIIKEKEFISISDDYNYACCGAYGFKSLEDLYKYACKIINDDNNKINNEYYISSIIKSMINDNYEFYNKTIDNKYYFSLGTPEQVNKFSYLYLFDLDGTLIDTDELYLKVWKQILNYNYNYKIDKCFFNNYIKGLSDDNFIKSLIPDIKQNEIELISKMKDDLFINSINEINFYEGSIEFLKKLQNNNIAIVSNCNKKVAMNIINNNPYLKDLISIIITADDCINKKPHPEPYLKAINLFNNKYKLIAFEDSNTGYLSAKNANIDKIFMKINDITNHNYKNFFNNYNDLLLDHLYQNDDNNFKIIKNILGDYLINIDKNNFNKDEKAGYICQIYSYKITNSKKTINVILKLPNYNNSLTITAEKLELFNNEYVFYKYFSSMISNVINIPSCLGVCNDTSSILMEDLIKTNEGSFNLNLNENVDLLLKVIKEISKLHNSFIIHNLNDFNNKNKSLFINKIKKINEFTYYNDLILSKFNLFKSINNKFIANKTMEKIEIIINKYSIILNNLSTFPLILCHGDLKSPNIFYKNNFEPYFLDFQYINFSKGTTDIIFLLCESLKFDKNITELVFYYYYNLIKNNYKSYDEYLNDIKLSLCAFPLFVCIWFNTEDINKLNDKSFPLRFMKNFINYFEYLINENFINKLF